MPFSKVVSQPWMFFEKFKGAIPFKQLKGFANTQCRGKLNKQVDVVGCDMQLINLTSLSVSYLHQEKLTIHPESIELKGVSGIFNFPDKVEGILSEAMFSGFQIHFSSPKSTRDTAHANLNVYFEEPSIQALRNSQTKELNLLEDGDSSPNLKVRVSSPLM